jgi:integrase
MASVFKPTGAKKYVIIYVDETGRRRKKTGATDKAVSERIARDIENRVALRREGVIDAKAEALVTHEARPLAEHLAEWRAGMLARGMTTRHADQYHTRAARVAALARGACLDDIDTAGRTPEAVARAARALADAVRPARLSDLTPERVQTALARLRAGGKSNQTVDHHRAAARAFCRWACDTGRLRDNPMRGVKGFNVEEDRRHRRRALTPDEAARLLQAAERGPVVRGMTGPDRARLYALALGTGFRASELASLTPERFDLAADPPTVTVPAAYAKNGREAVQPLPPALADRLAPWLATLAPGRPAFDPMPEKTAELIRADLKAAGIPYATASGVADFHALRASYVSNLVASGASVKTCQVLARHSSPSLTIGIYAKASVHDIRGAVDALPDRRPAGPRGVDVGRDGDGGGGGPGRYRRRYPASR